ncbi:MAG: excinuclease ABC subunit UvrA [Gammaproteobacteria bacterium]|jgi:excinuclease ABC subunit A
MSAETISIRGARQNNLRNIDVDIPREQLVVITGVSGSGKSSLAFDTLYAEGQRRYVESLSTYARQFLATMEKPDLDHIEGLSPAISIEQRTSNHNPRSTVGTITEISDFLRLLFARVGTPHCPDHGSPLIAQPVSAMVDQVLALPDETRIMILAPVVREKKGNHQHLLRELGRSGFVRARIDGLVTELEDAPLLDRGQTHTIEVIVDRFRVRPEMRTRVADSFETALSTADGLAIASFMDSENEDLLFSSKYACAECGHSVPALEPRLFSFNSPIGACGSCEGMGEETYFDSGTLIRDPALSLSEGAISGWDRQHVYYYQLLEQLSEHDQFSMDIPFEDLDPKHIKTIFYGSAAREIPFTYVDQTGERVLRAHSFEGIIPNLERRFDETESQTVRDQLSQYQVTQPCRTCRGQRLSRDSLAVRIDGRNFAQISDLSIQDASDYFEAFDLGGYQGEVADKILTELKARLSFLCNVGLNYLTLSRSASTLSGGEAQRIRLASQIGAGLVGVMYVLDEPSIGLHQRDNEKLLNTLIHLRDLGNSVIVVEHDEDAIRTADYIIDMGPGAGEQGGEVIAAGPLASILACSDSKTGQYLSGNSGRREKKRLPPPPKDQWLVLHGAHRHNLKRVSFELPSGLMTVVTGVSGSGKSTLINKTLYPVAAHQLNRASKPNETHFETLTGLDLFDKVINIDQSPIGRTPRSNPATYTQIFNAVRDLFAGTPEARSRGYKAGRFSFNVKGGRCEVCQGDGQIKVEMHFLPDFYVQCDECQGRRYNRETLEILYKGKTIADVLNLTVAEALPFLGAIPVIKRRLSTLIDVGLGYIRLGQSALTLSGGEAQRVKLARELARQDTGQTLYILDEPTTGLHFHDIEQLLDCLEQLKQRGNTLIVIEHNLDVIAAADWVIDLGPEGGEGGGHIIAAGTPESVATVAESFTGQYLAAHLAANR